MSSILNTPKSLEEVPLTKTESFAVISNKLAYAIGSLFLSIIEKSLKLFMETGFFLQEEHKGLYGSEGFSSGRWRQQVPGRSG